MLHCFLLQNLCHYSSYPGVLLLFIIMSLSSSRGGTQEITLATTDIYYWTRRYRSSWTSSRIRSCRYYARGDLSALGPVSTSSDERGCLPNAWFLFLTRELGKGRPKVFCLALRPSFSLSSLCICHNSLEYASF